MQQILTERHSGKTKQMTNGSVSTFKGKFKFFHFKIVKCKTLSFQQKNRTKTNSYFAYSISASDILMFFMSDLMHNSTGYAIIKTIGSCF